MIYIKPVSVKDSGIFMLCVDMLQIDKNSSPSVEIIQMSYLQYILEVLLQDEKFGMLFNNKLSLILNYCLDIQKWRMYYINNKPVLEDTEKNYIITHKQFDDIKRIILYQNIPHYDDAYVDPAFRKAMQEVDEIKSKDIDHPNLERRMAIITAHCGLPKREQLAMTLRSHSLLFEEVCGEVEFTTIRPIALFGGKGNELDHWIYHKKKGKFDGYISSVEEYNKSIGGSGAVQQTIGNSSDALLQQYNKLGG